MSDKRKPLAALLIEEKAGGGKGEPPGPEETEDEESMAAEDFVGMLPGVKDPEGAASALIDTIRACIAKSRKGGYSK